MKRYKVIWTETALDALARLYYPWEIKVKIYYDILERLQILPERGKKNPKGKYAKMWRLINLYQTRVFFEVDEDRQIVFIRMIKHLACEANTKVPSARHPASPVWSDAAHPPALRRNLRRTFLPGVCI